MGSEPIIAVAMAVILAVVLIAFFGWRHPRGEGTLTSLLFVLLVLIPILWAGALWIAPAGPLVFGTAILPMTLLGILIILLLALAAEPPPERVSRIETESLESDTAARVFGVLFWILLILVIASIIVGYAG